MTSKKQRRVLFLGVVMVFSILTIPVMAAEFPTKPVTLIVPFSPGGATDLYLRLLAEVTSKYLGQPIVIDYKLGGAGTVGPAVMAATSKPDGYTVAVIPPAVFSVPYRMKVSWDPLKDFSYIVLVATYATSVIVRADAPWKTFREFVDYAKANPNKVTYATSGTGTAAHTFMEKLALREGIKWVHVPTKGDPEVVAAVLGGHVTAGTPSGGQAAQVEAGQLCILVTIEKQRTRKYPQIPCAQELYGIGNDPRWGIAGPKGMDPKVVKILHDAFKKGLEDSVFLNGSAKISGVEPSYLNTEDYVKRAKEEYEERGKEAEEFGLKKK